MTFVSADRWTCPHETCRRTVTFEGHPDYIAAAIRTEQTRHGKRHRENALLEMRIQLPQPHRSLWSQGAA